MLKEFISNHKKNMIEISHYLDKDLVKFFDVASHDDVLNELINLLDSKGKLRNKEDFKKAIIERESIVSTGIGMGIAVPHAKLSDYNQFFIAIGIHQQGVEWNSLDGAPVHLIFMIGGPDNLQTQYLQMLSNLTSAIKDEDRRKKLLQAKTPEEVLNLFEGY